jgi:hypothetical protein
VDSSAQIFYALDDDLPAAGPQTVTLNRNDNWGSLAADVIEFSGAEQDTFFADHAGGSNDVACNTGADCSVTLEDLPAGSVVYAVGGGNSDDIGVASAGGVLSLVTSEYANYIVLGSGYSDPLSGSASATFDFTGCLRSVMYAVGVRPDTN